MGWAPGICIFHPWKRPLRSHREGLGVGCFRGGRQAAAGTAPDDSRRPRAREGGETPERGSGSPIANSEPELSARARAAGCPRGPTRNRGAAGVRLGWARGAAAAAAVHEAGSGCPAPGTTRGKARRPPAAPGRGPPGEQSCPRRVPRSPSR